MCLKLGLFARQKTAKKDIVVYKMLDYANEYEQNKSYGDQFVSWGIDRLVTPFQRTQVDIGKTLESKINIYGSRWGIRYIDFGIHSFPYLNDCIREAQEQWFPVIVKCIIPAGSIYYTGRWDGTTSIASNSLKYVKVIDVLTFDNSEE